MPKYVIIESPIDQLSEREQTLLTAAFDTTDGFNLWPRAGATARQLRAAAPVLQKLEPRPFLPKPPSLRDWVIWHHRHNEKREWFAADKNPAVEHLLRGNRDSRIRAVHRAVNNVEKFRREAPSWWFRVVNRLMVTDAVPSPSP